MTGTCAACLHTNQSRSYLNHLVHRIIERVQYKHLFNDVVIYDRSVLADIRHFTCAVRLASLLHRPMLSEPPSNTD